MVLPQLAAVAACGGGTDVENEKFQRGTGGPPPTAKKAVQAENALQGTDAWVITKATNARHIEGFASAASVNTGHSIAIHVSYDEPTFRAEVFRLGWYGGKGGCLKASFPNVEGVKQAPGIIKNQDTMLLECDWPASFSIYTAGYCSGLYVVKLTTLAGWQQYVSFVVRDDRRSSAVLMQSATATYHAYNPLGRQVALREQFVAEDSGQRSFVQAPSRTSLQLIWRRPNICVGHQGAALSRAGRL